MISLNNHTLTGMYTSKGKLLKTERWPGKNSGRITNGWLIKRKKPGATNYSQFLKKQFIIQKVKDNWKNTKGLFRLINKLTNNTKGNPLPNRPPRSPS